MGGGNPRARLSRYWITLAGGILAYFPCWSIIGPFFTNAAPAYRTFKCYVGAMGKGGKRLRDVPAARQRAHWEGKAFLNLVSALARGSSKWGSVFNLEFCRPWPIPLSPSCFMNNKAKAAFQLPHPPFIPRFNTRGPEELPEARPISSKLANCSSFVQRGGLGSSPT